ncbi:MAG: hypothetical protein NTU41_02680 [Chloroflexi bacterium]|nr:hypothetical protein [Chloroflexota bacterium]
MPDKEIQELADGLGISPADMARIRRERLKRKLLYPGLAVVVVACSSGLGVLAGKTISGPVYPFGGLSMGLVAGPKKKNRRIFIWLTVLLSVTGFAAAYGLSQHRYFQESTLYSVFPGAGRPPT